MCTQGYFSAAQHFGYCGARIRHPMITSPAELSTGPYTPIVCIEDFSIHWAVIYAKKK